jgi:CubicO group peptidase (beta-lactamase class C family)
VCTSASAAPPPPALRDTLEQKLQGILDAKALHYNTSFSFAVKTADFEIEVASGISDHGPNTRVRTTDLFPLGSITKTYTAAAIVRLAEAGEIDLDGRASPLVNKILRSSNGTTLETLWGAGSGISDVTVRDLLMMRAGLNDYDDQALQKRTFAHPDEDVTVFDFLHRVNKTMICPPATCGAYSSINYMLLGLILAQRAGVAWDALDQLEAALPRAVRVHMGAPDMADRTRFFGRGPCTAHAGDGVVANQYRFDPAFSLLPTPKRTHVEPRFASVRQDSCLNGWTCGNIAASAGDVARFYDALLRPAAEEGPHPERRLADASRHVVSGAWRQQMTSFLPLTVGWSVGLPYGLGLMPLAMPARAGGDPPSGSNAPGQTGRGLRTATTAAQRAAAAAGVTLFGHGGMDYGSTGMGGYNPTLRVSVAIAMNSEFGMNTTWAVGDQLDPRKALFGSPFAKNFQAQGDVLCEAYDAVLGALDAGPRLDCGFSKRAAATLAAARGAPLAKAVPDALRGAGAPTWLVAQARRRLQRE